VDPSHLILRHVEQIIVFHLCRCFRGIVVIHRRLNKIAGTDLEGIIEDIQVEEVFDSAGLVLFSHRCLQVVQVREREVQLFAFTNLLKLLNQVARGLANHHSVISFVGRDGGRCCE